MRVCLFGHSYVRDLERLGNFSIYIENTLVSFKYFSFPGFRFRNFLENPSLLDNLISERPDIVVVILGGNDISVNIELKQVKGDCKDFFNLIRSKLSSTFVIASQIEFRHICQINRHGSPSEELYKKLANHFNNWLNKQRFKDKILIVNGGNKLCDINVFKRDGVHLNFEGLRIYFDLLLSALKGPIELQNER